MRAGGRLAPRDADGVPGQLPGRLHQRAGRHLPREGRLPLAGRAAGGAAEVHCAGGEGQGVASRQEPARGLPATHPPAAGGAPVLLHRGLSAVPAGPPLPGVDGGRVCGGRGSGVRAGQPGEGIQLLLKVRAAQVPARGLLPVGRRAPQSSHHAHQIPSSSQPRPPTRGPGRVRHTHGGGAYTPGSGSALQGPEAPRGHGPALPPGPDRHQQTAAHHRPRPPARQRHQGSGCEQRGPGPHPAGGAAPGRGAQEGHRCLYAVHAGRLPVLLRKPQGVGVQDAGGRVQAAPAARGEGAAPVRRSGAPGGGAAGAHADGQYGPALRG
mmetsp:Transcript_17030/g.38444  ORF Transcript_17030/g.38444 Transcript_17030/m.38444 type:complete len:324 (+) Transcript_17030:67-1038(+)